MKRILIIGGGIIGQFTAYYLSKSDYQITIVDKPSNMSPASEGNCGLITPSHIAPINSFHSIFEGLKSIGSAHAPLKIQPHLIDRLSNGS